MKSLMKKEKGFTLIEVLVALLILAIIGTGLLMALTIASKAIIIADERTTAESLARSQMEHVKNQDYSTINVDWDYTVTDSGPSSSDPPDWWVSAPPPSVPDGYNANVSATPLPDPENPGSDLVGIQKITVTVSHLGDPVITLEDYKVDR